MPSEECKLLFCMSLGTDYVMAVKLGSTSVKFPYVVLRLLQAPALLLCTVAYNGTLNYYCPNQAN